MAEKRNDVKVALLDGNVVEETPTISPKQALDSAVKKSELVQAEDKPGKKGLLISVVDYPQTIDYGDAKIRLSGRANEPVNDISKLGELAKLPKGVKLKVL